MSASEPATSYTSRLLMPTSRFSIMSTRPKPCALPMASMVSMSSTSPIFLPSSATGLPFSKLTTTCCGSSGASLGSTTNWKASAGGATHGSSSTPHSLLRPHRFSSMEYGLFFVSAMGMSCAAT